MIDWQSALTLLVAHRDYIGVGLFGVGALHVVARATTRIMGAHDEWVSGDK